MAKLGEVCKVSPSTKNIERQGAWLLNLDMVEQQTGRVIEYKYVGEDDLNGSIIQFDTENVLYSKLRPNLNKVVLPQKDGFSTSELLPLRPDAGVLNRDYLAAFLRSDSFVTWAVSKTAGAKMPRLGTKDLMNAEIPVPSIEQQKKIAEKFKKLEQLISLRKQQLEKLDKLVKARFVEMFGELDSRPKQKIKDITKRVKVGFVGTCEKYYTSNSEIPMLRTTNITAHGIDLKDLKYVTKEFHEKNPKSQVHAGDLLIARHGANGQANAYYGREAQCLNAIIIEPDINITNSIFLEYLINSIDVKSQINKKLVGSTQHVLNTTTLANVEVSIPEMREQQTFSAFVERVNQQKQTVQQSLEKLELMKKALMQEYFG